MKDDYLGGFVYLVMYLVWALSYGGIIGSSVHVLVDWFQSVDDVRSLHTFIVSFIGINVSKRSIKFIEHRRELRRAEAMES